MQGKTLVITLFSENSEGSGYYTGIDFGKTSAYTNIKGINIPYLYGVPIEIINNAYFKTLYFDFFKSSSTAWNGLQPPRYYAYDDGSVSPLNEVLYLTVSEDIEDVFPRNRIEKSRYKDLLNDKVVLDLWSREWTSWYRVGDISKTFERATWYMNRLSELGMDNLAVIYHIWQFLDYDQFLPQYYPARPAFGTEGEFITMINSAKEKGWLFSLHENYRVVVDTDDYCDGTKPLCVAYAQKNEINCYYWDANTIAYDHTFRPYPSESVYGGVTTNLDDDPEPECAGRAHYIAANYVKRYGDIESNKIREKYAPNMAYLDAFYMGAGVNNYKTRVNRGGSYLKERILLTRSFGEAQQERYRGPLVSEGGGDIQTLFVIGAIDGMERELPAGELHRRRGIYSYLIPDFELNVIKPVMFNHGVGYSSRYFSSDASADLSVDPTRVDWDNYRANEIAYGHAGFIDEQFDQLKLNQILGEKYALDEYYLTQQLQKRYADVLVKSITYYADGTFMDLSEALKSGYDFMNAKVLITYENGLKIWVNRDSGFDIFLSQEDFFVEYGDFSQQDYKQWRYEQHEDGNYRLMIWNADERRWVGEDQLSQISREIIHPGENIDAVRSWVSNFNGEIEIDGFLHSPAVEIECYGNGVAAHILKNDELLWAKELNGEDGRKYEFSIKTQVRFEDRIRFVVDAKGNAQCDTTNFDVLIKANARDPDWKIDSDGNGIVDYILPSNGWLAIQQDEHFIEYSGMRKGQTHRVDFVDSSEYVYVNARGIPTTFETTRGQVVTEGIEVRKINGLTVTCDHAACRVLTN